MSGPPATVAEAVARRTALVREWGHLDDVEPDRADADGWDGTLWDAATCVDCEGPADRSEDVELRVPDVDDRGCRIWRREVRPGDVPEVVPVCASCRAEVRP